MITEVIMPKLGLTMDEGTILSWMKGEGENVKSGEALLSIETDKVTLDVESPANGTLVKIVVPEGKTVPLGEVIAYIGDPGEEIPVKTSPVHASIQPDPHSPNAPLDKTSRESTAGLIKISPLARKLAEENHIDLAAIQGSGPQGRIVEADILAILNARVKSGQQSPVAAEASYKLRPLSAGRKVVALRMSESFRTIPHFYLGIDINATLLVDLRQKLLPEYEQIYGVRLSYNDLILKALAFVLPKHPLFNAAYHSDMEVKLFDDINLGMAIAGDQGLIVGVIHHCDRKTLGEIAQLRHALVIKAQEHKLTPPDITRGTFTLSNLGMYGIDNFSPIINPGQSAILAVGAIVKRPIEDIGMLVLRSTLRATLAVDHRVADGADGALFLKDIRTVLEAPAALLD